MKDIEEIKLRIKALFAQSQPQNVIDHRAHYKWELGDRVYSLLRSELILIDNPFSDETVIHTIYGYPVEINKRCPHVIKLWKEIEP